MSVNSGGKKKVKEIENEEEGCVDVCDKGNNEARLVKITPD